MASILTEVTSLFNEVRGIFDSSVSGEKLDAKAVRDSWTGRKSGVLTLIGDNWLKPAPSDLKKIVGQEFQKLKAHIEAVLAAKQKEIASAVEQNAAAHDRIDLSLSGVERAIGTAHIIRQTYEELERIFFSIGFSVVEGPEIETPYYNFEALNIPEHHPARDNMDTFYIEGSRSGHLLRTHTSPMQIRTMEKQPPPVRIIVPGKVYRRDNPDSTHGYMFHQIEGLAVDTDITFCDFKGTRRILCARISRALKPKHACATAISRSPNPRRKSMPPATSVAARDAASAKQSGWIELFGAGMVDPAVYGFVKYDAAKLSGFAFGMGVDRLAMMKYGITELPLLFQNDVRFLSQFPVLPARIVYWMKIVYDWLKEFVDVAAPAAELRTKLSLAGVARRRHRRNRLWSSVPSTPKLQPIVRTASATMAWRAKWPPSIARR